MYEDFGEIRADVTDRLTHAVTDRSVPMHTPVVATADADARVMVLRGVERGGWLLRFHTDARAPKVAAILRDPRIAVLGYDKQAKIQLRMRGRARIERDGARVEEAWADKCGGLEDMEEAMLDLIRQATRGRTTLIATHSAAVAAMADRVVRL